MNNIYHILNGDALREQFPSSIEGTIYIARECLVEGDISGDQLTDLYKSRADFLSVTYGSTAEEYHDNVVSQFEGIRNTPSDSHIHLWFEDDLFCQVNFWFVLHLLRDAQFNGNIYLVRPEVHTMYGFGGLSQEQLIKAYEDKVQIADSELVELGKLWRHYQLGEYNAMKQISELHKDSYPFILDALHAHLDRLPANGNPGRPEQTLITIMEDLQTREFGPVFREFCKREPIYGFGDLQVKRIFDEINT